MNRFKYFAVALSVMCTACVKNIDAPQEEIFVPHEYVVSLDSSTKTSADAAGKLSWNAGDVVRYYSTSNGTIGSATVSQAGASASLTMDVASSAKYLVAVYGGTGVSQNTSGNAFVLDGAVTAEQSGKFEDAHIAVAKTYDVNTESLKFVNVTSLIKFTLERTDVAYAVFKSNDGSALHGDGTLKFTFSDENHTASFGGSTGNSIKVTVGNSGTFYISTLACTMADGFTMTFYKADDSFIGVVSTDKSVALAKNKILNLGTLDSRIDTHDPTKPDIKYEPNLSLKGTANCYIVPIAGEYYFDATVKGGSTEKISGSGFDASVLWESFGNNVQPQVGDIVTDCRYENGKIYFKATGADGNAVIALADRDDEVVWSWHIWCCMGFDPDFYAQDYFNNAGTVMDRNLGATSATKGDVKALGLMYQWGRKDPFLSGQSINSNTRAKSTITWPSAVSSDASNGTIDFVVKHPTTFVTSNSNNYDWYYTDNSSTDNTRWNLSKGMYDPCPKGWKVPGGGSNVLWAKAFGTSSSWTTSSNWDSTNKGMDFGSTDKVLGSGSIWYPASGSLIDYLGGSLYSVGTYGYYWSCTPDGSDAYRLDFNDNGTVSPSDYCSRAFGESVRCVKERTAPDPEPKAKDLSADGTSNCYIISDSGYYMFRLERGNGVVPASLAGHFGAFEPKSVFALWSSYNTETAPASADAFTKELEIKDGYVRFFVPNKIKGNAVIAALDGNGEICWSWHLWFTEKPADIALASCTWMDRNVGAMCAVAAGEVAPANASGFFYSWGRKDPMRGVSTYDMGEEVATAVAPGYSWGYDYIDKKFMIDTFIKTPMTYYEDKGKVWVNTDGSTLTDLWNGETKTMNDPCPVGYRLPSNAENTTLATDNSISLTAKASSAPGDTSHTDNYSLANHTFTFGPVVYPLGGAYVFGGGYITTYGYCGRYCSSSYNKTTTAFWVNINTTAYNVNNSGALTQGGMARCIKIK